MELFIQLSIIMIGKQAIGAVIENVIPFFKKKYKEFRYGKQHHTYNYELKYLEDYKLLAWDSMGLFQEYLEMVIQYGYNKLDLSMLK